MKKDIAGRLLIIAVFSAVFACVFTYVLSYFNGGLEIWHCVLIAIATIAIDVPLSVLLSKRLTGKIVRSMETMFSDIENVDENAAYSEMSDFAKAVKDQQFAKNENEHMRHEFTANVSHELKTPLTSISGYAEMIATGMATGDDVKTFAEKIHSESGRLVVLIGDIIKLSELDENNKEKVFEDVDLYVLAQDTAELLSFNAQKLNVTICVHGEKCIVNGNEAMLSELIYNLCDNAIRYNRKNGRVDITVKTVNGAPALSVSDTGIGIEHEHQSRIFERFYRVDKSRSKETGGTGLGLAIVKHIAILHEASIETVSDGKTGTTITVRFPNVKKQIS